MSDDKIKKLFKEATAEAITKSIITPVIIEAEKLAIKEEKLKEQAIQIVEEGNTGWKKFMKRMDGDYADRFMQEMDAMSGREFVRNYLKALEYTKPKVTRQEAQVGDEEDNVLRIEVRRSSHVYDDAIEIESEDITKDDN